MTHGFDDQGSQYDAHGNVKNWWTPADKAAFDQRTGCEVKEYGDFEPVPGQKLNGKLTLGENTADNGGLRIAYQALQSVLASEGPDAETKKIDGYTPAQRYFISFAQVWCENTREQYSLMSPRTSPGRFRTNGVVQFGKAFGCKKGDPMMPNDLMRGLVIQGCTTARISLLPGGPIPRNSSLLLIANYVFGFATLNFQPP